jgi:hypothetical protein
VDRDVGVMHNRPIKSERDQLTSRLKRADADKAKAGDGANLGWKEVPLAAVDKIHEHKDAGEINHVLPGLIFIR